MELATQTPTIRVNEVKLERLAEQLLAGFNQPVRRMLRDTKVKVPMTPEGVKEKVMGHLEQELKAAYPAATNLEAVLATSEKTLDAMISRSTPPAPPVPIPKPKRVIQVKRPR